MSQIKSYYVKVKTKIAMLFLAGGRLRARGGRFFEKKLRKKLLQRDFVVPNKTMQQPFAHLPPQEKFLRSFFQKATLRAAAPPKKQHLYLDKNPRK